MTKRRRPSRKLSKARSAAARRKAREFKKRSLAAIKGWRTRRCNQRKRSLAAKKGWETRRRNARQGGPVRQEILANLVDILASKGEISHFHYEKRGEYDLYFIDFEDEIPIEGLVSAASSGIPIITRHYRGPAGIKGHLVIGEAEVYRELAFTSRPRDLRAQIRLNIEMFRHGSMAYARLTGFNGLIFKAKGFKS